MKNRLTEWLVEPYLNESPDLDVKVGDVILMGRFKNKKVKVKSITYNEKGDLLINGKPALKFRKYDKSKLLLPSKKKDKDSVSPDPDMRGVEDENPIKKEDFAAVANALYGGDIPSPSRKKVKKMKKKGHTSVPYGSGYKKINEQTGVKKVVAIYPGRFQPFGPHHKKVFDALKGKFDEVYIATSNIQRPPRHPMNFKEKKKHIMKMGVPAKNIIQEKNPYKAEVLKKFGDDTAAVYVVGKKDAGRLSSGKYFKDFKLATNKKNLIGYKENGYVYSAPHVKVSGISSGTEIRNLLGNPKFDDKKRQQIFKKTFGYFDKSTYEMMTSRFGKLFEFFQLPQIRKLVKEASGFGSHFDASIMSDEGMYDFFGSLDDYYRVSPEHAHMIGYEVIDFPIRDTEDMMFTIEADEYEKDRAKTVTYGRTVNQNRKNTESIDNPFPRKIE